MNNQIEQLAEEAGFMDGWFSESGDDCETEIKRFAELIVKEILNISDEVITIGDGPEWLICERLGINHDWRRQYNFWS
jgi:hypothetical protein